MATFDTLKIAENFAQAGFDEQKSRTLANQFGKLANNDEVVTKDFLKSELEKFQLKLTIRMAVIVTAVLSFFKIIETFF